MIFWKALRQRNFLVTWWPWRALAFVVGTPVVAGVVAVPVGVLSAPGLLALSPAQPARFAFAVVGLAVVGAGLPWVARPLARVERRRLRLVDPRPVPHHPPTGYRDAATWREVAYAVLLLTLGPLVYVPAFLVAAAPFVLLVGPVLLVGADGPVALGFVVADSFDESLGYALVGLVVLPVVPYLWSLVAAAHAAVARALLYDDERLVEVARSRARLVDGFDAERRRIERDLHDGAQEKLVGLTLRLGLARLDVPADSPAHEHVTRAHEEAKQLMADLRELVRGIHPKVLADRGLAAALEDLASRGPVPVDVAADLPPLPPHVESTAYFVVAEALTNVARHSGASAASVRASAADGVLVVEVRDDGRGGADAARGTGLTGLADRVAVLDGRMALSSPAGGPTLVRVELPWSA
ncbi:sensor histidine kinase [Saccharothrix variisporea]|uniref:histidine kinase n=1 Tax=Saccharothrix variisporea TaxID=543527 RepID=A0A495X077_9PSEU|nr:sensor domain-containing protein [Saccharothrix variisporea]RKT67300.1 signal transduction histidine kinase [Saccharothrix variisporea]